MPSCSIVGCGLSYKSKEPKITLHRLPHNEVLKKKWLKALIGLKINSGVKNFMICSRHFEDSCFNKTLSVMRLREDAVPTIFDSRLLPRGVKRTYNSETASLTNPRVRLVDCTKITSIKTNASPVREESSDDLDDNNEAADDNNDDGDDYNYEADDHDSGSDDSTLSVQEESYGNQKSPSYVPVMECSEEEVSTPAPVSDVSVDPLKIQKLKRMRASSSYDRASRQIVKLKEKNMKWKREIKRLNAKIRRQLKTITKLRGPNGAYKDSVDIYSSTKPVLIGYVCDDVMERSASLGTQKKIQYLDKKDLKLRRVNNTYDNPVYEFVSGDEADCGKKTDKQNTAHAKSERRIRELNSEYWKLKLSYILHKTQFCGLCLSSSDELNAISDELEMYINGTTHRKTLLDIVEITFKEAEDVLSNSRICNNCKTSLIESYIFNENIKETSKMLNYHLSELYNKTCYIQNTVLNDSEHPDIRNVVFSLETNHKQADRDVYYSANQEETRIIQSKNEKPNFFKCMKCNISLSSYRQWKEHKETHKNNHKCRICNLTFKTSDLLTNHFTVHFTTKCRICQGLVQDGGLLTHLKKCHTNSIHLCTKCNVVFYSSVALDAHNEFWHSKGELACLTCRRSFPKEELAIHKCRFACPDRKCDGPPCIHHKFLMSFREQILSLAPQAKCPDCHYVTANLGRFILHANKEHLLRFGTVKKSA